MLIVDLTSALLRWRSGSRTSGSDLGSSQGHLTRGAALGALFVGFSNDPEAKAGMKILSYKAIHLIINVDEDDAKEEYEGTTAMRLCHGTLKTLINQSRVPWQS